MQPRQIDTTTDWRCHDDNDGNRKACYQELQNRRLGSSSRDDHPWPTSSEEIKRITEWFAGGDSYFAVCLKDTGRFIGFVSLNQEQKEDCREFNIGYIFNSDYHGKGYAKEACRAAIGHAFDRLQAHRVVSGTAAANRASCRLLERLGLKRTAESIGSFRNTQDGKPIEFVGYTFAISRDEWKVAVNHE